MERFLRSSSRMFSREGKDYERFVDIWEPKYLAVKLSCNTPFTHAESACVFRGSWAKPRIVTKVKMQSIVFWIEIFLLKIWKCMRQKVETACVNAPLAPSFKNYYKTFFCRTKTIFSDAFRGRFICTTIKIFILRSLCFHPKRIIKSFVKLWIFVFYHNIMFTSEKHCHYLNVEA